MKNVKVYVENLKRLGAGLGAVALLITSGCGKKGENELKTPESIIVNSSFVDLLDTFDYQTQADEYIELLGLFPERYQDLFGTDSSMYYNELPLSVAADKMFFHLQILKKLRNIDFSAVRGLKRISREEGLNALKLTMEEIDRLIESLKKKPTSIAEQEEQISTLKKLDYLYRFSRPWIIENGNEYARMISRVSLEAALAEALSLPAEEIRNMYFIKNPISKQEMYSIYCADGRYYYVGECQLAKEAFDCYRKLTNIPEGTPENEAYDIVEEAAIYAKIIIATGLTYENGEVRTRQRLEDAASLLG